MSGQQNCSSQYMLKTHAQDKTYSRQDMLKTRHTQDKSCSRQDMLKTRHAHDKTCTRQVMFKTRHAQDKRHAQDETCSRQDMLKTRHAQDICSRQHMLKTRHAQDKTCSRYIFSCVSSYYKGKYILCVIYRRVVSANISQFQQKCLQSENSVNISSSEVLTNSVSNLMIYAIIG